MSGPFGPSILSSSAYGGFRDVGREVARQRQRKLHESRRQSKLLLRRTMLPSNPYARPGEADTESGSIDYLIAHSGSSYDSHSAYGRTPSTSSAQGSYLTGVSSWVQSFFAGRSSDTESYCPALLTILTQRLTVQAALARIPCTLRKLHHDTD